MHYQWFSSFDTVSRQKDVMVNRFLVIAGPSGVGKSVLATALSKINTVYIILRNYTTRDSRPTDSPGHFAYLSDQDFIQTHDKRQFFMCRLEPPPMYGYKTKELSLILASGKRPTLMFRHSGIKYILESLGGVPTVFIEGDPKEVARHSRNKISPPTDKDVMNTISANRQLQDLMTQRQFRWLRITNNYGGNAEVRTLANTVNEFLSNTDEP
ncbi:hypothetical protein CEE37_09465 [candidate division LCP-89 bacterium B3_LCP]|uniref:Guanylate kinase-like domain-containing protein n=1 Tax=candidate division LCP-89 bacterium B3_LCP TaxID=2012998 RepID=A0A532UYD9_UNCL8|nr:MAG: hypothetical protein CEE37_09465 [candidate division LCP-89 bacterium B3_LCP]